MQEFKKEFCPLQQGWGLRTMPKVMPTLPGTMCVHVVGGGLVHGGPAHPNPQISSNRPASVLFSRRLSAYTCRSQSHRPGRRRPRPPRAVPFRFPSLSNPSPPPPNCFSFNATPTHLYTKSFYLAASCRARLVTPHRASSPTWREPHHPHSPATNGHSTVAGLHHVCAMRAGVIAELS